MRLSVFLLFIFIVGCASRMEIKPRAQQSQTTVSVVATKNALLAGGLHEKTEAIVRQGLLDKNVGIPVAKGAEADMTLRIVITGANFTNATSYEWQLIENANQRIVAQKAVNSSWGHTENEITDNILSEIVKLDLAAYKGGHRGDLPVQTAQAEMNVPESATDGSKSWAVVIGVNRYRNQISPADYADADAELFSKFAQTTLGIPENQVKVLLNDRASRSDIAGALFEWLPKNAKGAERVYVFFSGHGAPHIETGDAYLVPYDADPKYLKSGGLSVSEIQSELSKIESAQTYLFLDACFSGTGSRSVLAKGTRPIVPVKETESKGVITITASAASEATGLSMNGNQGLFTFHLVTGLTGGADGDRDSNVSLSELREFVTSGVKTEARQDNREQTPTFAIPKTVSEETSIVTGLKTP